MYTQAMTSRRLRTQQTPKKTNSLGKLKISKSFLQHLQHIQTSPSTPKSKVKSNLSLFSKTQRKLISNEEEKVNKVPIRIGRIKCKFIRCDDETDARRIIFKKQHHKQQLVLFDRQQIQRDNPEIVY